MDGYILEYNDVAYGKSLGATGHHENRLIAYKWGDKLYETIFLGLELATTRTGMVSLTGKFADVKIDGATVNRAFLHNLNILDSFNLGIGDKVKIYKANMIIPQMAENITKSGTLKYPDKCPCCGSSLAHMVLHGHIYGTMSQYKRIMKEIEDYKSANSNQLNSELQEKQKQINKPLFQSLGGTSADKLKQSGRERPDGMSLSRSISLSVGGKVDYLLCAESGPGQTDAKGLIVPKYGSSPEQRVSVAMNWQALNEIILMTKIHYEAWLAAKYTADFGGNHKTQSNPEKISDSTGNVA